MALVGRKNLLRKSLQSWARAGQHGMSSSPAPQMPPCDFKPDTYKGMEMSKVKQVRSDNLNPALFTYYKKPLLVHQGHMQWLWDVDGTRYLDLFGGIVTVSVGHCHPTVRKRAEEQLGKLWHTTNIYLHPTIHEYAEKLTSTRSVTL